MRLNISKSTVSSAGDTIQYYDTNNIKNKSSYYYYFRLVGCGEIKNCEKNSTEYLFDELPFFQPRGKRRLDDLRQKRQLLEANQTEMSNLYLVEPDQQRGIHCRFGMPGMIAANHYDASRNAIAVLGGNRRYILSRSSQCKNTGLFPQRHPSARHSKVDWTTAYHAMNSVDTKEEENSVSSSDTSWRKYKEALFLLANATSTEVLLQAGDVLYLPSYWFHFIVSLDTNMQCNTRSGRDSKNDQVMTACGFPPRKEK